jgi:hypothetical protein
MTLPTVRSAARGLSGLSLIVLACTAGTGSAGCWKDIDLPVHSGSLGGQVVISGAVRGARVSVDQLDLTTGVLLHHVGDAFTDDAGRFAMLTGTRNGIFKMTSHGGAFQDLATGATIQLDDTDELTSLIQFRLLDAIEDAGISPIGHLVEAHTMARAPVLGNMTRAYETSKRSLHQHFGDVNWTSVLPWPLDQPASLATDSVRAGLILAALSVLARDIAAAAQAGPQEVNLYRLIQRWAEDLRSVTFDGDDGDDRTTASGLQLGSCPPVAPGCIVPADRCATGYCRQPCDLYSGTPRTLFAGALVKVINDSGPGGLNQTSIDLSSTSWMPRAVANNLDPGLFEDSCIEPFELNEIPPSSRFDPATPDAAAAVTADVH